MTSHYALTTVLLVVLCTCCSGYPDGPPEGACVDMQPGVTTGVVGLIGHLSLSQNERPTYGNKATPPYYMHVYRTGSSYAPGQEIQVSILANQTTGLVMYKGLLLQARKVICTYDLGHDNQTILVEDEPIGTFRSISSNRLLKTMTCNGVEHSTVCHRSPQFKINETVTWVAPDSYAGHVVFRATIVQEANIYWKDVFSGILTDPTDRDPMPRTCGADRAEGYTLTALCALVITHFITASH